MDGGDLLPIGEVARRAGVAASALRYYEEEGLVAAVRPAGGQRRYPRSVLRRLAFVRAAQNVGLTLDEIRDGARDPARGPHPHEGRLGPALARLALAAGRADRRARGAARRPDDLHRLRLPVAARLRADEPRRSRLGPRPGRPLPARRAQAGSPPAGGAERPAARRRSRPAPTAGAGRAGPRRSRGARPGTGCRGPPARRDRAAGPGDARCARSARRARGRGTSSPVRGTPAAHAWGRQAVG